MESENLGLDIFGMGKGAFWTTFCLVFAVFATNMYCFALASSLWIFGFWALVTCIWGRMEIKVWTWYCSWIYAFEKGILALGMCV